ncbi:unnamed protein product [Chilo suppressalis]|uniref:Odorant binding protein n=2 Tax=Chilo suppressalis TaxID=168631 RepID=A0ABN8AY77_CHISP|nr:unnamed protein product [Chilo suppressalis]
MVVKLLLMFLYFVTASYASRTPTEIKNWILAEALSCSSEVQLSENELQMLVSHKLPNSKSSKCYLACVYKKVGWLDAKGRYQADKVKSFVSDEYAGDAAKIEASQKLFDTCKPADDKDEGQDCERANTMTKCFLEHGPKMGFNLDTI